MSMMVSFVLSFFPRDVLDEILNLIESVSEDFPSYSYTDQKEEDERGNMHIQGVSKKTWTFFENAITPSFMKESSPNFLWE